MGASQYCKGTTNGLPLLVYQGKHMLTGWNRQRHLMMIAGSAYVLVVDVPE